MYYNEGETPKSKTHFIQRTKTHIYNESARSKVANTTLALLVRSNLMINTIVGFARSARHFDYTFFVDICVIHEMTTFIAKAT